MKRYLVFIVLSVVFFSCSKDDEAENVPPSSLTYNTQNVFIKNTSVVNLVPTSTGGAVASYSISPALPEGLSLNTATGVISGMPTIISSPTTYVVTASNSVGATSFEMVITVNDIAPSSLSYNNVQQVFFKNDPIVNLIPTISGGAVSSYSISPALPTGLSINAATGVISGTPTVTAAATTYTVTATNSGGSISFDFVVTINDPQPISRIKEIKTSYYVNTQTVSYNSVLYYYENGLVSSCLTYSYNQSSGGSNDKQSFIYQNGKIVQIDESYMVITSSGPSFWSTPTPYVCTYSGDLISTITGNPSPTSSIMSTYSYNNSGQMINSVKSYINNNTTSNNTYNYQYYPDGNLYKKTSLTPYGTYVNTFYSYDNKNNPYRLGGFTMEYLAMNTISVNNPTAKDFETNVVFEYNAFDYPIKRTAYVNGNIDSITIYTYE